MLGIEYHVYIGQVSPQLSCGDTCQICMWFKESNRYFFKIKSFAYGEINERSFSNPHPWGRCIHKLSGSGWNAKIHLFLRQVSSACRRYTTFKDIARNKLKFVCLKLRLTHAFDFKWRHGQRCRWSLGINNWVRAHVCDVIIVWRNTNNNTTLNAIWLPVVPRRGSPKGYETTWVKYGK